MSLFTEPPPQTPSLSLLIDLKSIPMKHHRVRVNADAYHTAVRPKADLRFKACFILTLYVSLGE